MGEKEAQVLRNRATILKTRKTVLGIEKVLKSSLAYQLLSKQKDQKQKIKIRILNQEEERKTRKRDVLNKVRNKLALKTGIVDSTTNFLANALFGFLFTKIIPVLPNLLNVVNALKPVTWFITSLTNLFLNTIGGFIEIGYKTHDTIKKASEQVTKIPIKKEFDNFQKSLSNSLSTVVNVAYGIIGQKPPTEKAEVKSKKPVKGAAVGGPIGYNPPKRELKKTREQRIPRKQTLPETRIGKDVGGEAKVREFYRSPKPGLGGILGIFKPKNAPLSKSPVDSISDISKTLRRRNLLFGDIASVGSDLALGQKPNKTVYRNTAKDVLHLAQVISDKQQQQQRESIVAMAYGGTVPSRALSSSSQGDLVNTIALVIQKSIEERANKAMNDFKRPVGREEMMEETRKRAEGEVGAPGGGGGGGTGAGGYSGGLYGGYRPKGNMERQIYEYLTKEKKLNDIQALGLMANIERESSFNPKAKERGGTGIGLFQWSHGRSAPFLRAVPDWETNWKAQIDYALNEPESLSMVKPGSYATKTFASAQEAADWWMSEWERPADKISGSRKHGSYLSGVPKGPTGSAMFRESEMTSTGNIKVKGGVLPSSTLTSRVGMRLHPLSGVLKMHQGNDFGVSEGTDITVLKDGIVTRSEINGSLTSGYGNLIEIQHSDGSKSVYAHLALRGVNVGDSVKKGSIIGKVGSTGGSTGAHLHFEYDDPNGKLVTDWRQLNSAADKIFRFGDVEILPSQTYKLSLKDGKEGILENSKWKPKAWTKEEKERYNKTQQAQQRSKDNKVQNKLLGNNKKEFSDKNTRNVRANRQGSITQKPSNSRRTKKQPVRKQSQPNLLERAKNTFKRITGFKRGGFVGDSLKGISQYAPYELSSGGVIFAVQPMIIQKETLIEKQIPVPFPMPSSVNTNKNHRS